MADFLGQVISHLIHKGKGVLQTHDDISSARLTVEALATPVGVIGPLKINPIEFGM